MGGQGTQGEGPARTGLRERLAAGAFVLTAELDPPRGPDLSRVLERARRLAPVVDAINFTDGARAKVRCSSIATAALVQRETGAEAIAHVTCRDRNVIALQTDLLGAWALGVRNVLVLGGDPPKEGDHPNAKAVYDVDPTGLVRLAARLNEGVTGSGGELDGRTDFLIGCAGNPGAAVLDRELEKLALRVEAGARFCQTQPVFDVDKALRFQEAIDRSGLKLPVLFGLLPLRGVEAARYFDAIPGMAVPPHVIARLEAAGPEGEEAEGLRIAVELAEALRPHVRGLHLFPMGRVRTVLAVAEAVGRSVGSRRPDRGGS
jgi:5,10-methylenetetrahydrofolate reductase